MHFSLFPAAETAPNTVDLSQSQLFLYPVLNTFSDSKRFDASGTQDILQNGASINYQSSNRILHYNTNTPLQRGYYILSSHYSQVGVPNVRITFASDPYICPHNMEFADIHFNFQGCSPPSLNQPGYPCLSFDYYRQKCLRCAQTHTLTNGTCLYQTACPPRHYFKFGSCFPVS